MDWKQKRIEDLNTRLLAKIELLGEYEKKLDYEKEPSEKKQIKDCIENLKEEIETISSEIQAFSKDLDENTPDTNSDLTEIRQKYYDEYVERKRKEKD